MNEQELKAILARNPQITARDNRTLREIHAAQPEQRTPDALDSVVQGKTEGQGSVTVQFTFCRVRLVDVDAIASGAKDLLDGLQNAALIPGDSPGQIVFSASQKKVGSKSQEGVAIQIDYE